MDFVENYQNFLLASGEIPESYYSRNKVHLNNYGTRKLLSNIGKVHRVAAQSQASVPDRSGRMYRRRIVRTLVKVGLATTKTDLPNFAIYVCVMDTLHKSVGLTVGMRVGRCVSHVRDATSV